MRRINFMIYVSIITILIYAIYGCKKENNDPTQNENKITYAEIVNTIESVDTEFSAKIEEVGVKKAKESVELLLDNNPKVTQLNYSPDSAVIFWILADSIHCSYTMDNFDDVPDTLSFHKNKKEINHGLKSVNGIPHNTKALLLSPHYWEWKNPLLPPEKDDLNYYFNSKLTADGYDVTYKANENKSDQHITLEDYLNWDNYGVISFVGHGAANGEYFTINSGVDYTIELYNQYQAEFWFGQLGVNGGYNESGTLKEKVFITSIWFGEKYDNKLDDTFILMSACESLLPSVLKGFENYLIGDNSVYWGWSRSYYPHLGGFKNGRDLIDYLLDTKLNCCDANDIMDQNGENYHQFINSWPWPKIYLNMSDNSDCDISLIENGGNTSTFTDPRDGQEYDIVTIGDQTWFAKNLNYETTNSWWYTNSSANGDIYGRLYTWNDALIACPDGWHLPGDDEWKLLEIELGMSQDEADATLWRGTVEGKKMKSINGWYNNGNGSNTSGFNGLSGGFRRNNGAFDQLGHYSGLWSSTPFGSTVASWSRSLSYENNQVGRGNDYKTYGFSVRCLKD